MLALLTDTIIRLVSEHGYLAIFVLMLLDSACVPFPSEVTLLFGGALTSTLVVGAGQELSLVGVVFWAIAGTLIGSWLAYGVGYAGGRPAIQVPLTPPVVSSNAIAPSPRLRRRQPNTFS